MIPGQELGSHVPCGQKSKTQNRSSIVANSIRTLKMFHIKKKKNLKKNKWGETITLKTLCFSDFRNQ